MRTSLIVNRAILVVVEQTDIRFHNRLRAAISVCTQSNEVLVLLLSVVVSIINL